jgi:hypothetical protein
MAELAVELQLAGVQSMGIRNGLLRRVPLLVVGQTPTADARPQRNQAEKQSNQKDKSNDALLHE